MEATLSEIITEPNKQRTFSVLSSIENNKMNKSQNTQPNTTTKRYSIPTDLKDSFYAIRHYNPIPKKRARKNNTAETKRKKKHHQSKTSLYQTCHQLWPTESMDFSYDYVKSLSDLLKVRLTQARFKLMSTCLEEHDDDLFSYLKTPKPRHKVRIYQQNKSSTAVIGNSKNLFNRMYKLQKRLLLPPIDEFMIPSQDKPATSPKEFIPSPDNKPATSTTDKPKKKLKETKKKPSKPKRITTPKRRSIAADIMPAILEDGTKAFLCEPCNKKYKNRNGLAYHMERCKKGPKPSTVQCQKCYTWAHSDSRAIDFYCSKCKQEEALESQSPTTTQQVDATKEDDDDDMSSQFSNSSPLSEHQGTDMSQSPNSNNKDMDVTQSPTSGDQKDSSPKNDVDIWGDFDMDGSSNWNMSDLNILPPSLLFSDHTSPLETHTPTLPPQDWFQFANFQDDYEPMK